MTYTIKHKGYIALISSCKGKMLGVVNMEHSSIMFEGATFKELIESMDEAINNAIDSYGIKPRSNKCSKQEKTAN